MDKFLIHGGKTLKGKIEVGGSKNCALPVLFSTLLSPAKHIVSRVPRLHDMDSTLKMLVHLGCSVDQKHSRSFGSDWIVDATTLNGQEAPYDLVRKMRASTLVLGPLLARTGFARVSLPGGCAIGARPIDLHLMGLQKLGAIIEQSGGYVETKLPSGKSRLKGAHIIFPMVSVGATENILMAASLADGKTILENAAQEPEVRDLCEAMISMGAKIKGHGTSRVEIDGVTSLGAMNFKIPADRIEAETYLIAAQITGGEIFLEGAAEKDMTAVLELLKLSGAKITVNENGVGLSASPKIQAVDIKTGAFPGIPTDIQAQWMALMTQADGDSLVTETIFENRFMHVPELQRMGAKLSVSGSTVKIRGERGSLHGAPVMATDLRASACLVLAALAAKGESSVKRIYHLDRGYESMETKLRALGADVDRTIDS